MVTFPDADTIDNPVPIPTRKSPLVDRYRNVTDAWWPHIQTLFKSVRAAVGAVQETVDALNGVWTLSVNASNRIIGQIKLDGSAALSTFSALADRFIIVHPTVDGTTIQAFITGLVNGISTIGINGNLIVDGTVIARNIAAGAITAVKISVSALDAIAANIGTITAGKLQRADGAMVVDLDNKRIIIST